MNVHNFMAYLLVEFDEDNLIQDVPETWVINDTVYHFKLAQESKSTH